MLCLNRGGWGGWVGVGGGGLLPFGGEMEIRHVEAGGSRSTSVCVHIAAWRCTAATGMQLQLWVQGQSG